MIVKVFGKKEAGEYEPDDFMVIKINGNEVFTIREGMEPEDVSFGRDLSCVCDIPDLLRMAHKAGTDGESFDITYHEVDSILDVDDF